VSFTEINPFITEKERLFFISMEDSDDWIQHKSSVSGRLSPLFYKTIEYRGIKSYLLKMHPNAVQDWHTDGVTLKRNTLILHPLTENYAPYRSIDGVSAKPIIADTQVKHSVVNNEYTRMNLQIPFIESYKDVHANKNSVVWKLLNKFYKENNEQR